jgi:hypothetical protein
MKNCKLDSQQRTSWENQGRREEVGSRDRHERAWLDVLGGGEEQLEGNTRLRAVRVASRVRHAEETRLRVLQGEVLV